MVPQGEGAGCGQTFPDPAEGGGAAAQPRGAAFAGRRPPAGQRRAPRGSPVSCRPLGGARGRAGGRVGREDAVLAGSLPARAGAGVGAVQPGHGAVPVSLLRVFRLGRLQNHLQGHPLHPQPAGAHSDPVSSLRWFKPICTLQAGDALS